ncbi:Proteasome assembly chaperone 2 [Mycena venus]|uniref:Proteasome assembly chaperone 2 n=1 Tax=Mycena venus TaxID=2733690 RepID=A0A8H6YMG2_9AGAR|nr:Proteasome assembly chaperone 2 [Mycena venus]
MVFFNPTDSSVQLAGKAIIVPVVSTANVSQLAADLLIASLSLGRIGIFDSAFLVPVVGSCEDGVGVSTPLELYGKAGLDIVVVQQRSPALKSQKQQFINTLLEFTQTSGLLLLIILVDEMLNVADIEHQRIKFAQSMAHLCHPHRWPVSPNYPSQSTPRRYPSTPFKTPDEAEPDVPFIPGGSLTRRILQTLSKSPSSVPTAAVLQFVLEGDNRADAALLASVIVAVFGLSISGFKEPRSWKQGLFGAPPDQTLYG